MRATLAAICILIILHVPAIGQTRREQEAIGNAIGDAVVRAMARSDEEAYKAAREAGIAQLEREITDHHRGVRTAQQSGNVVVMRRLKKEIESLQKELKAATAKDAAPRFPPINVMYRLPGGAGSLPTRHPNGSRLALIIERIVSPSEIVVHPEWPDPDVPHGKKSDDPILISHIPTDGLRVRQKFMMQGCFRVGRTKLADGESMLEYRRIGPFPR